MSGFSNAVVGGMDILKRNAIRSFNYVAGVAGWTVNKDGSAQFNELTIIVQANGAAVLIYYPSGGLGNLIGSWAAAEFTDQYGNDVPTGLNANSGTLSGITLNQPSIVAGVITQTLLNACTIANANLNGGTSYEQTITFDTGGGLIQAYSQTTTTVTQTAHGDYTFTVPAGITNLNNVYVWGAGAGGDGGSTSVGGNGGGGGGVGGETSYPVTAGALLAYTVGAGGSNSTTGGGHGADGGDSFFDLSGQGVYATGGQGNGTAGQGIGNTINHTGGSGGASNTNSGAASGGNSANTTGNGNNGIAPTGSTGAASPASQTGSGTGGAGGASGANGSNGTAPGAGGGGAGKGTSSTGTLTKTYEALYTASYYGPDATNGNPNGLRSTTTMYQGGETASGGAANGNQRCVMVFDSDLIASDFAGYTAVSIVLKLVNQHSWYNSGMTIEFDAGASGHKYPKTGGVPSSWLGSQNQIGTGTIAEGSTHSYSLGSSVAALLTNNQTNFLGLGAFVAANHPYDLSYYGYFAGGHSVNVEITITGQQTVAGSTSSGNGADGKVTFSYTASQVMAFALSPVAGSDSGGNAFGVGYTGPVNVFDPNASPAAVEGWHSATLINGWTKQGFARYKLIGYNVMLLQLQINDSSATSGTFMNMPTGYSATLSQFPEITEFTASAGVADNAWIVQVNTGAGGGLTILNWAKKSHQFVGNLLISLD